MAYVFQNSNMYCIRPSNSAKPGYCEATVLWLQRPTAKKCRVVKRKKKRLILAQYVLKSTATWSGKVPIKYVQDTCLCDNSTVILSVDLPTVYPL